MHLRRRSRSFHAAYKLEILLLCTRQPITAGSLSLWFPPRSSRKHPVLYEMNRVLRDINFKQVQSTTQLDLGPDSIHKGVCICAKNFGLGIKKTGSTMLRPAP
jgi:hypothetical protein